MEKKQFSKKIPIIIGLCIAGLAVVILLGKGGLTKATDDKPTNVLITPNSASSVTITWSTGVPSRGQILYSNKIDALLRDSKTEALPDYAPEEEDGKRDHQKVLEGLQAGTTYYFQIQINESIYDNNTTPWTFTTPLTNELAPAAGATDGTTPQSGVQNPFKTSVTPVQHLVIPDSSGSDPRVPPVAACTYTNCNTIKENFGKGCSTQDYIRCLNK